MTDLLFSIIVDRGFIYMDYSMKIGFSSVRYQDVHQTKCPSLKEEEKFRQKEI